MHAVAYSYVIFWSFSVFWHGFWDYRSETKKNTLSFEKSELKCIFAAEKVL
jgi:hypothetical protein